MPQNTTEETERFLRPHRQASGRYGDGHGGHGLSLLVKPRAHGSVAKSWSQRLRINGKPCNVGLGPFPIVNLAEAREAALENARAVYRGHDPRKGAATPSFDKAAEIVIEIHASTWRNPRTADIWRSSFRRFVSPTIGSKPIGAVTSADILSVLTPIWNVGKHETARRLRHRIGAVMRWSIGAGHRSDIRPETPFLRCCQRTELPRGDTGGRFIIERWRGRWRRSGRPPRGKQPSC